MSDFSTLVGGLPYSVKSKVISAVYTTTELFITCDTDSIVEDCEFTRYELNTIVTLLAADEKWYTKLDLFGACELLLIKSITEQYRSSNVKFRTIKVNVKSLTKYTVTIKHDAKEIE